METRDEQPEKKSVPIVVSELGILMETREEQPLKTPIPIVVTEIGKTRV
jgi:hypothetical protein